MQHADCFSGPPNTRCLLYVYRKEHLKLYQKMELYPRDFERRPSYKKVVHCLPIVANSSSHLHLLNLIYTNTWFSVPISHTTIKMFAKSSILFLIAAMTAAYAARIPTVHNYGTMTAAERVHNAEGQQFLITDITKPHVLAGFQANFFANACNDGFLGQVTGSGGATCVQSWPGTKAIALLSQPSGCRGKASRLAPFHPTRSPIAVS